MIVLTWYVALSHFCSTKVQLHFTYTINTFTLIVLMRFTRRYIDFTNLRAVIVWQLGINFFSGEISSCNQMSLFSSRVLVACRKLFRLSAFLSTRKMYLFSVSLNRVYILSSFSIYAHSNPSNLSVFSYRDLAEMIFKK